MIGLSQSLAKEFYPNDIRVNCIGPGLFRAPGRYSLPATARAADMEAAAAPLADGPVMPVPGMARTGHPEDIAYAALYLASDEASWVTGQVLNVDGGVDMGTRPLWAFER